MEQQDWEESAPVRWPEPIDLVMQIGAVGVEKPEILTDTQEVTQKLPPPIRIKAAPSNLEERHPPTGLPLVKLLRPLVSGGTTT